MMTTVEAFQKLELAAETDGRLVNGGDLFPDYSGDTAIARVLEREAMVRPVEYQGVEVCGLVAVRAAVALPGVEIPHHEDKRGATYWLQSSLTLEVPSAISDVALGQHVATARYWLAPEDPAIIDYHYDETIPAYEQKCAEYWDEQRANNFRPHVGAVENPGELPRPEILAAEYVHYGPDHGRMVNISEARKKLIRRFLREGHEGDPTAMISATTQGILDIDELPRTISWLLAES